jgi:hypothetical protein
LVRRLLDSEDAGVALTYVFEEDVDGSDDADDPNILDSRRLDFFLCPNMAKRSSLALCGARGRRVGVS